MSERLFDATLANVSFNSLASELVLVDIVEKPAEMDTQTAPLALREGLLLIRNHRKSLSVELRFAIRTQDVVRRAEVRDMVAAWARNGGMLKVNYRPDRVLYVKNDNAPSLDSSLKWTNLITLTLTAYEIPYWQSEKLSVFPFETGSVGDGEYWSAGLLHMDGDTGSARVEAMIQHIGDDVLDRMRVSCGSTFFEFEQIDAFPGDVIVIAYNDGVLTVDKLGEHSTNGSLLRVRTAESSDDLLAASGEDNQITVSANQKLKGQITARGLWR